LEEPYTSQVPGVRVSLAVFQVDGDCIQPLAYISPNLTTEVGRVDVGPTAEYLSNVGLEMSDTGRAPLWLCSPGVELL
jgi:hypothetical protein